MFRQALIALGPEGKCLCMAVSKFRIRFRKAGDLRFLSHHDLLRLFERMLRRAGLPFRSTEGFHPKPKMAFASALALGIIGHEEVLEIEFEGTLDPALIQQALTAQAPEGLEVRSAHVLPKLGAQVRRVQFFLPLPADARPDLCDQLTALLALPEVWVERVKFGEARRPAAEPPAEERFELPSSAPPPVPEGTK